MSAKSCGVGIRVDVAILAGSVRSSCMPSGRTLADAATTRRTRFGWFTASSRATAAPMLCPNTWARSRPSWSSIPTTSLDSAAGVIPRPVSPVRPCPCSSTPITVCRPASVGISDAKFNSIVIIPPCSSSSGDPCPYCSTYMCTPLTSTYPVSRGAASVVVVMVSSPPALLDLVTAEDVARPPCSSFLRETVERGSHQHADPHPAQPPGEAFVGPPALGDQPLPERAVHRRREHVAALGLADRQLPRLPRCTCIVPGRVHPALVDLREHRGGRRLGRGGPSKRDEQRGDPP